MTKIEEEVKPKKAILDYVSVVDFFSTETAFGFEGEDNFKTMCGGITSLLIMVICLIVAATDNSYYLTNLQLVEVLDQTPFTLNSGIFAVGIRVVNLTSNQSILLEGNWAIQFSCDDIDAYSNIINSVVLPSTNDCTLGDYCLSPTATCDVYKKAAGATRLLRVTINFCDFSNPSICDYSTIQAAFGTSATDTFQTQLMVSRMRPSTTQMGWNQISSGFTCQFNSDYTVQGDTTIRRDEFTTNTKFLGAMGLSGNTLFKYNTVNQDPLYPSVTSNGSPTPSQAIFDYTFTPDIRVNQYAQQFTDLSGMLSAYFAVSGVILVFYSIVFSHYSENMLNISVARHLHYMTGPDQKLINFSETNIMTILTCMLYFQSLGCIYPNCLRPHITMIEAGRKKLNLNNILEDLAHINSNDTGKNPVIRLRIDENEEQSDDQKEKESKEDLDAKLSDFLRKTIHENILSIKEIQIFIQWVKMNGYSMEEAKVVAQRIFTKRTTTNSVFVENEYREYQSFKESMKEGECDDLYIPEFQKQDSQISGISEKSTKLKIKGGKSPDARMSLQIHARNNMPKHSLKKLDLSPFENLEDSGIKHLTLKEEPQSP